MPDTVSPVAARFRRGVAFDWGVRVVGAFADVVDADAVGAGESGVDAEDAGNGSDDGNDAEGGNDAEEDSGAGTMSGTPSASVSIRSSLGVDADPWEPASAASATSADVAVFEASSLVVVPRPRWYCSGEMAPSSSIWASGGMSTPLA